MRIKFLFHKTILVVCGFLLSVGTVQGSESVDIVKLLDQAENLLKVGVVDKGAGRSFEEAGQLVEIAAERLAGLDPSLPETRVLTSEMEAVRENIKIFSELYEDRFFGVLPLARLISRKLVDNEGFAFTEQLYHPPEVAAVNFAMRGFLNQVGNHDHPHVFITSQPVDRHLETVVLEVLLRDGRSTPIGRRKIVRVIDEEGLDAFARGEIDAKLVDRFLSALNLVDLIVITVDTPEEPDRTTVRRVRGDYYIKGEVVQGSLVDASPVVLTERFEYYGFARDRRSQHWLIKITELLMLLLAMACSSLVPWGLKEPLRIFYRLSIGFVLFLYGHFFTLAVVTLLRRFIPESSAMAASALWWPGSLGVIVILGSGLLAWIAQAFLTDIIPGERGERAVGTIFGLSSLGSCSYFVTPMLLLDGISGVANVIPLVLASVSVAALFGFAARTGPPVPHYFMSGPLLLAPMAGISILMASPKNLWTVAGVNAIFCLFAWIRHRLMVRHGTEELEPSPEEAVQVDQQILVKLSKKIIKIR